MTAEKLADAAVTVHKLATVPPPLPGPLQVEALRDIPLEAFFKNGDEMFWAPAYIGDITTIITDPDSGLTGGTTIGDADIAIAPLGVTPAMLADRSVTATKIDATPPSGTDPLKLQWSPTTGKMLWGQDFDSICPKGFMCGSTTSPVYDVTNTAAGIAVRGQADTGTGIRGQTVSGNAVVGQSTGTGHGVVGESQQGIGVLGTASNQVSPALGIGVKGSVTSSGTGGTGVEGSVHSAGAGVGVEGVVTGSGMGGTGVKGSVFSSGGGIGVKGWAAIGAGVDGESTSGIGVRGVSDSGTGVRGDSQSGPGVGATSHFGPGVLGQNIDTSGSGGKFETFEGRNVSPAVEAISRGQGAAVAGRRESNGAEGYLARIYGAYGQSSSGHSGYRGAT